MKNPIFVAAVAAILLTGCAGRVVPEGYVPILVTTPDSKLPNIFITSSGKVVVDQEPIRAGKVGDVVTVKWALPAWSQYTFKGNGIDFSDPKPKDPNCIPAPKTTTCTFTLAAKVHKYVISVQRTTEGGVTVLEALDPTVMSD